MKNSIYKIALFSLLLLAIFLVTTPDLYAGAGGTRGKGSGAALIVVILLLPCFIGYGWYKRILRKRAQEDAGKVLENAARTDQMWDNAAMTELVRKTFLALQELWSQNKLEESKAYIHTDYQTKYGEELLKHIAAKEFNRISGIEISQISIVLAQNYKDNEKDTFVGFIEGMMNDEIVNESGKVIRKQGDGSDSSRRSIEEYWQFQRHGQTWLLKNITKDLTPLKEASVDEESPAVVEATVLEGKSFEEYQAKLKAQKKRDISIAAAVGVGVTLVGYLVYVLIIAAIVGR